MPAGSAPSAPTPRAERLRPGTKAAYALGDFTLSTALSSLSILYAAYFLTQVAGLRPALAGLVPLIGRAVDAVTDPLMGQISDHTRWRGGRRRPYFLLGAIPFGLSFALLWVDAPFEGQLARFLFYTGVYCLMSVAVTVLSVPYFAIQPEMALDYDERTSLNTYRSVGAQVGLLAAIAIRPLAEALGGGSEGFALAGILAGAVVALPWLAVWRATFERPDYSQRKAVTPMRQVLGNLARHRSFRQLTIVYLSGRIAMDLIGTLMILYFTYWIGRTGDFEVTMLVFMLSVGLALPVWLTLSRRSEKAVMFQIGSVWWMLGSAFFLMAQPDWPRWLIFVITPFIAVGFAAADLMPWAMLGEVIDEDDLETGERREGVYNGVFTFLRKLGGAIGVFLVLGILDLAGFVQGETQSEGARQAVRWLTALAPAFFLAVAAWTARGYPLTRGAHAEIRSALEARQRGPGEAT